MLVMGGAILVALPAFQAMLRFKKLAHPACAPCYDLPSKTKVDLPLVLGALLFGAGAGGGWLHASWRSGPMVTCCFVCLH
jgi:hypothetical protein